MLFSEDAWIQIIIFILGLCGFMVARHIRKHKIMNKPLVCPVRFDCQSVVHSDYSKFLGVPVELAGMIYYAFVAFTSLFFIFTSLTFSDDLGVLSANIVVFIMSIIFFGSVKAMTLIAFLFSIYLLAVQIFVLKRGCTWCIASSLISALIFILAFL